MNKKLIAVAIATAVAAPVAFAGNTTLYGKAHVSIQSNDNGATDNYTVNSNASRLGIKGSEDLGDGLKAIFKYEMGYDMTDGGVGITIMNETTGAKNTIGSVITARNAYVGLSGGFGTVLVGRHDTPMKVAFYAAGNDHLGDSVADLNKIGFTERRLDNAIAYISPNMSGFTVAAAVVPGEGSGGAKGSESSAFIVDNFKGNLGSLSGSEANNLSDAYSLAAIYGGGGLKVGLGYEVATKELTDGAKDWKTWQAGASYTFGDFTVGAQYEDNSGLVSSSTWALAGKANFGHNYVMANYGEKDPKGANNNTTTFGIGVGHKFSKRTQVYAAYANHDNQGISPDTSAFAMGMIHTF